MSLDHKQTLLAWRILNHVLVSFLTEYSNRVQFQALYLLCKR